MKVLFFAIIVWTAVTTSNAAATNFPARRILLVVPYAPGGGTDLLARTLQHPLERELGVSVVIENRPSGSTREGTLAVMRSEPDGHTLLLMSPVTWLGLFMTGIYDFKPWEQLTPIAQVAETPYNFLLTRMGSGLSSWEKLVQYAQKKGNLIVAGPTAGGFVERVSEDLISAADVAGQYIPFRGSAPAFAALLGGHVDVQITTFADGIRSVTSNHTHALAVSSQGRHPAAPEVPTFAELGIGGSLLNSFVIWGPPHMPGQAREMLERTISGLLHRVQGWASRDLRDAYSFEFKPGAQLASMMASLSADWEPRLTTEHSKDYK